MIWGQPLGAQFQEPVSRNEKKKKSLPCGLSFRIHFGIALPTRDSRGCSIRLFSQLGRRLVLGVRSFWKSKGQAIQSVGFTVCGEAQSEAGKSASLR